MLLEPPVRACPWSSKRWAGSRAMKTMAKLSLDIKHERASQSWQLSGCVPWQQSPLSSGWLDPSHTLPKGAHSESHQLTQGAYISAVAKEVIFHINSKTKRSKNVVLPRLHNRPPSRVWMVRLSPTSPRVHQTLSHAGTSQHTARVTSEGRPACVLLHQESYLPPDLVLSRNASRHQPIPFTPSNTAQLCLPVSSRSAHQGGPAAVAAPAAAWLLCCAQPCLHLLPGGTHLLGWTSVLTSLHFKGPL